MRKIFWIVLKVLATIASFFVVALAVAASYELLFGERYAHSGAFNIAALVPALTAIWAAQNSIRRRLLAWFVGMLTFVIVLYAYSLFIPYEIDGRPISGALRWKLSFHAPIALLVAALISAGVARLALFSRSTESYLEQRTPPTWSEKDNPEPSHMNEPDLSFVTQLPHPKMSHALAKFRSGDVTFSYYENPKSIGEVTTGRPPPYHYPQIAVVSDEEHPLLIVRIEEGSSGQSMLCSIDRLGARSNLGAFRRTSRDEFMVKVGEVVNFLRSGKHGRAELRARKTNRPSEPELVASVAGVLYAFIRQNGLEEFSKDRLYVVVSPEFRVSISEATFVRGALAAIPLKNSAMHVEALRSDPSLTTVALDMAAREIVRQIP
jgi:hypothetical protein